jgi:hypothetical protein
MSIVNPREFAELAFRADLALMLLSAEAEAEAADVASGSCLPPHRCKALVAELAQLDRRIERSRQCMNDVDTTCTWFHEFKLDAYVRASRRLLTLAEWIVCARAPSNGRTKKGQDQDVDTRALASRIRRARRAIHAYSAAAAKCV